MPIGKQVSCRTIIAMNQLIKVVSHRPEWMVMFEDEAAQLREIFGSLVVAVHHIGSTSVPGLKAKPIIDLLLEVGNIEQVDRFNDAMRQLGYDVMGEYGLPRRRYFRKHVHGQRRYHVHTWQSGDIEIERHIAFRDYLIAHPTRAEAYEKLKDELVVRFAGNKEQYIAGKDAFCKETESLALIWQKDMRAYEIAGEHLQLVPLSAAQIQFCLTRPDQLEAELSVPVSRPVMAPAVVQHALRVKKQRLINASAKEFAWHTYWLMVITSEPFGAGLIGFKGIPDNNGEVEIGYGIDAAWRNKGYTTEATRMLIDWALQQDTCLAVTAWSDKDNTASARVLQKAGMFVGRETEEQYCWVIGSR